MEKKSVKLHFFLLILIVAIGFFLRFYRLRDYMMFLGDQGRDVWVVKKMILDGKFTLLGPVASVGGFYLGPLYYYLITPFLIITKFDPIGPAIFVAFIGAITPALLYFYFKNKYSFRTALIAAFFYAISPVLIKYNRFSWNPNLVPFFSLLLFIVFEKFLSSRKIIFAIGTGFLLGCLFQLHYLAFIFAPVVFLMLLIKRRGKIIIPSVCIFMGLIIGWFPFILYELRHQMQNFYGLTEFISRRDGANVGFETTRYFSTVIENIKLIFLYLFNLPSFVNVMILMIFVIYLILNIKKNLPLFIVFSIMILSLYKGKMGEHYFNILYIPILVIWADIFSFLFQKKYILFGILSSLIIVYYCAIAYPFWQEPNRQLDQTIEISRYILNNYTDDKPFNFALVTKTNSDHAYRYFLDLWGNVPVEILNDVIDPTRKTVTDKLIVLCEPLSPCPDPRGSGLWEIASFGRAEIVFKEKHGVYIIYQLKHWINPNEK